MKKPSLNQQLAYFAGSLLKTASTRSRGIQEFAKQLIQALKEQNFETLGPMFKLIPLPHRQQAPPICNKLILDGEKRVRSLVSGQTGTYMCRQCFDASDHKNYDFQLTDYGDTFCCCGDTEKWQSHCSKHGPKPSPMIDEREKHACIQNIQFAFHIFLELYAIMQIVPRAPDSFSGACRWYFEELVKYIKEYNLGNMAGNQITFQAFSAPFERDFGGCRHGTILESIWMVQGKAFTHGLKILLHILVMLLSVDGSKVTMITLLIKNYYELEWVAESPLGSLTGHVLTCPYSLSLTLEKTKPQVFVYNPVRISNLELITENFIKYYHHFSYIIPHKDFLLYQFANNKMSDFCGYAPWFNNKIDEVVVCYGIQDLYVRTFASCLKVIAEDQEVLFRVVRESLRQIMFIKTNNLFQGFQRSFSMALFMAGQEGEKLLSVGMLRQVGLTPMVGKQQMLYIVKTVAYAMKAYCMCLSDAKEAGKFQKLRKYVFSKNPILLSSDMFLVKFVFLFLKKYESIGLIGLFRPFFVEIMDMFKDNWKFFILKKEVNKVRKTILGTFTAFLGLMIQIATSDHYMVNIGMQIGEISKDLAETFYGDLLASVQPIKLIDFKTLLSYFMKENPLYLDRFIEENTCINENGKMQLTSEVKGKKFKRFNFEYLQTKKNHEEISDIIEGNLSKVSLNQFPRCYQEGFNLSSQIFRGETIEILTQIGYQYLNFFEEHQKILEKDYSNFSLYIEKLIMIRFLVGQESQLDNVFQKMMSIPKVAERVNEKIKRNLDSIKKEETSDSISQIFKILNQIPQHYLKKEGQEEEEMSEQPPVSVPVVPQTKDKSKFDQAKKNKLEKFKQKRAAFLNKGKQMEEEQANKQEAEPRCTYCRISKDVPLITLCLVQKTNAFTSQYLKINRQYYSITTCGHPLHIDCYQLLPRKDESSNMCNICKGNSNVLVPLTTQQIEGWDPEVFFTKITKKLKATVNPSKNKIQGKGLEFSWLQTLIESVSFSLLFGVMNDPEFYENNIAEVHYCLLNYFKNEEIDCSKIRTFLKNELIEHEGEERDLLIAHGYIVQHLISLFKHNEQQKEQKQFWRELFLDLPQLYQQVINNTLQKFLSKRFQRPQKQNPPKSLHPMNFLSLPPKLNSLTKQYLGRCPKCLHMSNQICICLICSFISCIGCETCSLRRHTNQHHSWGSVFIRIDNGKIIYVTEKKVWIFDSIYHDKFRAPYSGGKQRNNFALDEQEYEAIKKSIVRHKVEDRIQYREIIEQKTCHLKP